MHLRREEDIAKILDACFYVCAYGYFSRASNNKKILNDRYVNKPAYAVKSHAC